VKLPIALLAVTGAALVGGVAYAVTRRREPDGSISADPVLSPLALANATAGASNTLADLEGRNAAAVAVAALQPERTGTRGEANPILGGLPCTVSIGGMSATRIVESQTACDALRLAAADAENKRCNRTPRRLCDEDPSFCARHAGTLAGAGIATAASGGLAWPALIPPVTSWGIRLARLPCESEGEAA
jgi:hypothetical protein